MYRILSMVVQRLLPLSRRLPSEKAFLAIPGNGSHLQ
jgi:hypothetical protein